MAQKFNLKCDEFQANWKRSLSNLRRETVFTDVTLVTDDKMKFLAHKILLSSSSATFEYMLKDNIHANSLIFLSGVNSVDLGFILDYIYNGEVNLYHDQLQDFLKIAGRLGIVGLPSDIEEQEGQMKMHKMPKQNTKMQEQVEEQYQEEDDNSFETIKCEKSFEQKDRRKIFTYGNEKIDVSSMAPEEIEEKILDLCQKIDGVWTCLVCEGYTHFKKSKVRRHVEIHTVGLSYTCTKCSKDFRSKNTFDVHSSLKHRTILQN